jgi:hypothetical protein
MPTIEECKRYAAEYQSRAQEPGISIKRATALMGISLGWVTLAYHFSRLAAILKEEAK